MNIFIKIKNSIYNPQYYKEILSKPLSYSIKYYLLFSLIIAVIFGGIIFIKFFPTAKMLVEKGNQLTNYYPQELEIIIKDGKASANNISEPYFVKIPEEANSEINNGKVLENILVIDTKNNFSLEEFNNYKTVALLTADSFVYENQQDGVVIKQLKDIKDFKLNRSVVDGFINKIKPFFILLYPLVALVILFGVFVASIVKLIYLFFAGLILWIVFKMADIKIDYKKSYQLGIHLLTLPIIVESIIAIIPFEIPIPFLFTILLIILALINIKKESPKNITA